jgi:peptide/nickel transport system substrate-binding protein
MHLRQQLSLAALAACLLVQSPLWAQGNQTILRIAPHSNLTILDPIWTTAYISRNHGYMIYDTLFGTDEQGKIQPQMVDKWGVSRDKKTWTFTLRPGLEFSDGNPVTSDDVVASLARWGKRDSMGEKLMSFVERLEPVDAKTFRIKLKEPYGLVLESLGKPSSNVPFMMPKAIAETDPFKQISSHVGSGPFIYVEAESKPGDKHVYVKNTKYKPRPEPPSGLAGGKVVKVDRVEVIEMPDTQQQVNAIIAGEIDIVEQLPHDLIPVIKKEKDVKLVDWNPLGHQFVIRFNWANKPFDNPKMRLAALYCMQQEEYLKATVGEKDYYKVCSAAFVCGTPNAFEAPNGMLVKPDFEKSKALLKEAGYDGTPIVLMQSTTLPVLTNMAPVTKSLLERGGFKVDMQSMDWQTLVARRSKKDPPDKGGWNAFITSWTAGDLFNPFAMAFLNSSCDKALFGWPCDKQIEDLRDQFARATDSTKQLEIVKAIQARWREYPTHIHLGQWYSLEFVRNNIDGMLQTAGVPVLWNIEKK